MKSRIIRIWTILSIGNNNQQVTMVVCSNVKNESLFIISHYYSLADPFSIGHSTVAQAAQLVVSIRVCCENKTSPVGVTKNDVYWCWSLLMVNIGSSSLSWSTSINSISNNIRWNIMLIIAKDCLCFIAGEFDDDGFNGDSGYSLRNLAHLFLEVPRNIYGIVMVNHWLWLKMVHNNYS